MDFIREDNTQRGIIKALDGDTQAGELTYTWSGANRIIIDHTEVFTPYREKGLGASLVKAALSFARENDLKILPLCSFAKRVIEKDPANDDVRFTPGDPEHRTGS